MATDLYRISWRKGQGLYTGGSERKIYESTAEFRHALLNIQSEIWAYSQQQRGSFLTFVERAFRAKRGDKDLARESHAMSLITVEKYVDGDWVAVEWSFEPATLILDGVKFTDAR